MKIYIILLTVFLSVFAQGAALTVQEISETSYTLSPSANSTSGDTVANPNGDVFILFRGDGTATATITAQDTSVDVAGFGPLTKADLTISLTAGDYKLVGPFNTQAWNSSGSIAISYTGINSASVKVKPLRLKQSLLLK